MSVAYPQVLSWQNSPVVAFENKSQAELVVNGQLKNPFAVVTATRDEISLKLNNFDFITVFEKSKAQILEILNEGQFVPEFYLLDGRVRIKKEFKSVDKKSTEMFLKTPFFDLLLNSEADFFVELNMREAWVKVKVIKGSLPLEFLAYEKKLTLGPGEEVRFRGELADDKLTIKYDYLLNNRKAPRGQLLPVQNFDQVKYLKADEDSRLKELARKSDIEKKRADKIKKKKQFEDSFLCKKPFAQKNQCAWWLDKNKCYRKRCNVSGQWGDLIARPVTPRCKAEFTVSDCDY